MSSHSTTIYLATEFQCLLIVLCRCRKFQILHMLPNFHYKINNYVQQSRRSKVNKDIGAKYNSLRIYKKHDLRFYIFLSIKFLGIKCWLLCHDY